MVIIAVIVLFVVVGAFDSFSNWGKAYGNVTVNGISVGGMTEEEMMKTLTQTFGPRVSHAQVTVYANEDSTHIPVDDVSDWLSDEEAVSTAEQVAYEETQGSQGSWTIDALALKGTVPYGGAIERAMAVGRQDGGLLGRLSLFFNGTDITLDVNFDADMLESLASEIDNAIGDPRVDTTVAIEDGTAYAVEGHTGTLVDRAWLSDMLSRAMIDENVPNTFVVQATTAQSRISLEQANEMAIAVNKAIRSGATFTYRGKPWTANASLIGDWTSISIVEDGSSYQLDASIDYSAAIPDVVEGAGTVITSDDMVVSFEESDGDIIVHTSGSGDIPEVTAAVAELEQRLYGPDGKAWGQNSNSVDSAVVISINESDRPETLAFDQALQLGIITVIGEYTTSFSNVEGTENRNHNIKLAADILNNGIVSAKGGSWDFNDRSGNTNEEAGFWSAGSIIDGQYVDSIGGGICQVATTIFNAVYEAGLDVDERHNHTLYIASYPLGRDAAVDYPTMMSLAWTNDLASDILLKMSYTDETVTAQLYSVYTGYTTQTATGNWEEGERYGTRFEVDDSIGEDQYYRKTIGSDGSKISVTRSTYDRNNVLLRTDVFASEYEAQDEVYVVGSNVDQSKLKRAVEDE